ncbi:MAG: 2-polyprenyl-3-methyl-6-methoxy-1,4-benzoquinone monooxygenase [Gammaproteobacteria bacterium]|jgi:3-demethoxyubiquinol 3-hydroxylase
MDRQYSAADRLLMRCNEVLGLLAPREAARPNPAGTAPAVPLDETERRHAAGLMRVNHAGEVAAQGLYHGQALTARNPEVGRHLLEAAREERDHMAWCAQRLDELGSRPSLLGPVWYAGSFALGAAAGLAGDRWNLGFVAETERQVAEHLREHLQGLPEQDQRSRAIVAAMHEDESRHGAEAEQAGGAPLPSPVIRLMRRIAAVMKFGAYRL